MCQAFELEVLMDSSNPSFSEIALRPMLAEEAGSMLSSILGAVEYGVLLTDLDHVALASNRRFGELFGIDVELVVKSDVDAVRQMVESRIGNFDEWQRNLVEVYADPEGVQNDTLDRRKPRQGCVATHQSSRCAIQPSGAPRQHRS